MKSVVADRNGSQSSQWRLCFSKQSSIRCRGAGLGHPMDTVLSVQNQDFSRNRKELAQFDGADEEAKSHLHWQLCWIWQILWRLLLEPLYVNTSPSRNKWVAERAVRRIKEETSAVLLQSGLDEKWWADSMECYCYLRNTQDLLADGKTPCERRFGQPSKGPIIPFGSIDLSRLHQFGPNILPGIFLGYVYYAVTIWKGDISWSQILRNWKRWTHLKSMLVLTLPKGETKVPDRRCNSQTIWRRSGSENIHLNTGSPDAGEEQGNVPGESDGSSPPFQDSSPDDGEARNDFWSISGNFFYRHHVEPRVKLYVPREESFLFHWNTYRRDPGCEYAWM